MLKKTMRPALSVLLAFIMIFSLCSTALAAGINGAISGSSTGGNKSFVVLGDSMSNGYGMPGYYWNDDGDDSTYQIESELDYQNGYGYLMEAPDAWSTIVANELGMDMVNLSISGMRPTELRAILDHAFIGDAYTQAVFLPSDVNSEQRLCRAHQDRVTCESFWDGKYHDDTGCTCGYDAISEDYVNYITNADVIALHLGMNNFGSLVTNKLMAMLSGDSLWSEYDAISFKDVIEGDEEAIATYNKIYAELYEQFGATVGEGGATIFMGLADILAYSMAIFARDYSESYDIIRELNDSADIIFVTVSNPLYGVTLNLGGEVIALGDIFQVVVDAANAYMAAYVNNDAIYVEVDELDLFVDALARDEVNPVFAAKLVDSLLDDYVDLSQFGLNRADLQATHPQFNRSVESLLVEYVSNPNGRRTITDKLSVLNGNLVAGFDLLYNMVKTGAATRELAVDFSADSLDNMLSMEAALQIYCRGTLAEGIGIHPSENGHKQIAEAVITAVGENYTGTDYTIDQIVYYITEYYDEAYAFGYQYADKNGYVDNAVSAIDSAINAISAINADDTQMTDEFKAELKAELASVIATLAEIKTVLTDDKAADVDGMVDTVLALEDDLYTHLDNIDALLAQAGADVNNLVIIPALEAAEKYIKEEAIPAAKEAAKVATEKACEYLLEVLGEAYDALVEAIVNALEKYLPIADKALYDYLYNNPDEVIAFFEKYGYIITDIVDEYGDEALAALGFILCTYGEDIAAYVVENHEEILANMSDWFDTYGDRIIAIMQVYAEALGLCDAVRDQMDALEAELDKIDAAINDAKEEVKEELETLRTEIEAQIAELEAQIEEIKNAIDEVVKATLTGIDSEIKAAVVALEATVKNVIDGIVAGATTAEYVINANSYYVALGDSTAVSDSYVELLADELGISYKNLAADGITIEDVYAIISENSDDIARADLITVGFGGNTFINAAVNEVLAAEKSEFDWAKYVGEAGVPYVEEALGEVYTYFVESGLENAMIEDLPGALTAAVEAYVYSCVAYATNLPAVINALENISPEAFIIIVGMYNPMDDVVISLGNTKIDISEYVDYLVKAAALESLIYAAVTGDAIYVDAPEVDTLLADKDLSVLDLVREFIQNDGANLNPSSDGDEYIKTQILDALTITYEYIRGDVNGDGYVNDRDAIYLLRYTLMPEFYPINQNGDMNGDGDVNDRDAIYLLRYTLIPESYPLY